MRRFVRNIGLGVVSTFLLKTETTFLSTLSFFISRLGVVCILPVVCFRQEMVVSSALVFGRGTLAFLHRPWIVLSLCVFPFSPSSPSSPSSSLF